MGAWGSLDDFVGAGEQLWWDVEAEHLRSLEIDDQLDFRRLLYRQVARLFALKNAPGVEPGNTPRLRFVVP